jgi:hypothetical protein
MRGVAGLNESARRDLFTDAAGAKGMTPESVEKDFWICWMLMVIFEHPDLSAVLRFKGGTSLSKCFSAINRFSEDIDLILDWDALKIENPKAKRTNSQQDKFNKQVNVLAQQYIRDALLPMLQVACEGYCNVNIAADDPHTINVQYPSIFPAGYLRPEIRLEIGPLAEMVPYSQYAVTSYAAEINPQVFKQSSVVVHAIKPERTFWEKVTILHAETHRPEGKPHLDRYARHYYDVHQMLGTDIERIALENLALLEEVVAFKTQFYPSAWAHYDLAVLPSIRLVPDDKIVADLRKDYVAMEDMFFGTKRPAFDDIIHELAAFEEKLHALVNAEADKEKTNE